MNWHPLLPDFAKENENYYYWSNLPKLAGLSLLYALHGGAYFLAAGPKQSLRRRVTPSQDYPWIILTKIASA